MNLADEILSALPTLMRKFPLGPHIGNLATALSIDRPSARIALFALEESGKARVARRGHGLHLLPADDPTPICVECRSVFYRAKKSKRLTCSRSCAVALSWKNEETKKKRSEAISRALDTPQQKRRQAAHNKRRWSKPGERERLSEMNRRRWADPVQAAKMANSIKREHSTPEKRKLYSDLRKAFWRDPKGRKKMLDGIRRSKGTPEARAKFSALLKARWQDPVTRPKLLAATRRNSAKGAKGVRGKKQSTDHVKRRTGHPPKQAGGRA